jgi:type IV fimbrial biogenesis protein FimT
MIKHFIQGNPPQHRRASTRTAGGFTIIEVMVVVLVVSVLLTVGLPAFNGYLERNRLRSAAEGIANDFGFARSEAIMRGPAGTMNVSFKVTGPTDWCYGFVVSGECDCKVSDTTDASACVIDIAGTNTLRRVLSTEYQGDVSMTMDNATKFSGTNPTAMFTATRGLANAGEVRLSADGNSVYVQITALGRVRICSPSSTIVGYPTC